MQVERATASAREFDAVRRGPPRPLIRQVFRAVGQLFSFETAFLLFIFAAAFKADPRFAWFPGDMTRVFLGLSVVAGAVPLLRGRMLYIPGIKAVFAGLVLVLWIVASQAWTPSEIYAQEKIREVAAGYLWCLIATAMIISSDRTRVVRFLALLLVFGVLTSVDFAINSIIATERPEIDYYLVLGRLCGLAALVAFAFWLASPRFNFRGCSYLAVFALCGYVLLSAGGRQPTAAVAIPMLIPILLGFQLQRGQLIIWRRIIPTLGLLAALTLGVVYLAVSEFSSLRTLQRFDTLVSKVDRGQDANPRLEFWRHAVTFWIERPVVGHGVGSWPILYKGHDKRHYPHNLVLELLVEFGLIGLILFTVLVLVLVRGVSIRRIREDPALMCATMLCVNTLLNAMSTGDLADNRNLIAMLGLLAMRPPARTISRRSARDGPYSGARPVSQEALKR